MGVAYFDVITEHVIETYLERRYARAFGLVFYYAVENRLVRMKHFAQLVQFRIHSFSYHTSFGQLRRGFRGERAAYFRTHFATPVHSLGQGLEMSVPGIRQYVLYRA